MHLTNHLPDSWLKMTAAEKYLWYAQNHQLLPRESDGDDSYFVSGGNCRDSKISNLMEYD